MPVRCVESSVGPLTLVSEGEALAHILFLRTENAADDSPVLLRTEAELREYFLGQRRVFDIPLAPKGTPFQMRVWTALQTIPYGQTVSYGDIARMIGCDKGFRAVGMANHHNPIPIIIPCHRVIGANGSLTGYGGGLDIKSALIRLEQENMHGDI